MSNHISFKQLRYCRRWYISHTPSSQTIVNYKKLSIIIKQNCYKQFCHYRIYIYFYRKMYMYVLKVLSTSYALHIFHYWQLSKIHFQFHLTCSIAFEADSLMAPWLFELLNLRNECINHLRTTNTPAQNSTYLLYNP